MKTFQPFKSLRFVLILFSLFISVSSFAQASADKLFKEGKALQATKTIQAQNNAIKKFASAKGLYASQENKKKCDAEIATCNKIKREITPIPLDDGRGKGKKNPSDSNNKYGVEGDKYFTIAKQHQDSLNVEAQKTAIKNFTIAKGWYEKAKNAKKQIDNCKTEISRCEAVIDSLNSVPPAEPVQLAVNINRLNFKRKPKDAVQTIEVSCNYPEWRVEHELNWISVFISGHEQSFAIKAEENTQKEARFGYVYVVCGDKKVTIEVYQDGKKGLGLLIDNVKKNANL